MAFGARSGERGKLPDTGQVEIIVMTFSNRMNQSVAEQPKIRSTMGESSSVNFRDSAAVPIRLQIFDQIGGIEGFSGCPFNQLSAAITLSIKVDAFP